MKNIDPRYYQIAVLGISLLYGQWILNFSHKPLDVTLILVSAQVTQYFFSKVYKLPAFDPKSALI